MLMLWNNGLSIGFGKRVFDMKSHKNIKRLVMLARRSLSPLKSNTAEINNFDDHNIINNIVFSNQTKITVPFIQSLKLSI